MGREKLLVMIILLMATGILVGGVVLWSAWPDPVQPGAARRDLVSTAPKAAVSAPDAGDDSWGKTDYHLGEGGPPATTQVAPEPATGRAREDYINGMFRPLALTGVEAALARVRELPDKESRDLAMLALLGEWSELSTPELINRGDVRRFGAAGALALYLMDQEQITPQQAAAMAQEFLGGREQAMVLARAAGSLASSDPAAALAMGEGLSGWAQMQFLERFATGWARSTPAEAKAWALQIPDPDMRSTVLSRIIAAEAESNPAAAAQTFLQMPPGNERERVRSARQIAQSWASQDTLSAMQWAGTLGNEAERGAAERGIRSAAPVGIGARLSTGDDGYPVLQDFVPGGAASMSGQLSPGDRLIAVGGAGGNWVDSRNMSLREVARLIQGDPNTSVTLQVQSAGSAPRVITLGRQQIVHRPPQ